MNHRVKSLLLLSGGLDSSAQCAFFNEFDVPSLALTFDYGQKAAAQEINAAAKIAHYFRIPHKILALPFFTEFNKSALIQKEQEIPSLQMSELDQMSVIEKTAQDVWVPNRNGIFISIASGFAEAYGFERVVLGFNKEEAVTFPDNSEDFLNASNRALEFSTSKRVQVHSYTTQLSKSEIVEKLHFFPGKFPFDYLWSCYYGNEKRCARCESCLRFERAMIRSN